MCIDVSCIVFLFFFSIVCVWLFPAESLLDCVCGVFSEVLLFKLFLSFIYLFFFFYKYRKNKDNFHVSPEGFVR